MNFRPELAAAVMAGEKTVTRRLLSDKPRSPWWREKCGFCVDQVFAVCPGRSKPNIGHAVVTGVEKIILGYLEPAEAVAEGFDSVEAFEVAFAGINGEYDPDVEVWCVEFEALTCIGFGDQEGECGRPSDVKLNGAGLWCASCERARRDHISGQMALVSASFGGAQ